MAAALVFRDGRLLITQRPPGSSFAGLWEFPGGKREAGEDWEDCLRRELQEELDVRVKAKSLFEEGVFQYPDRTVRLRFYLAQLEDGIPRTIGCAAMKWVERDELCAHTFPPADAALLMRLTAADELWSRM